jgi:hypothetical protein
MNIFKYINVRLFLLSLVIGLFVIYITMPDTRKIYVYPTPENVDILQYKDKTNSCFNFKQNEVPCPSSEDKITKIPVQS